MSKKRTGIYKKCINCNKEYYVRAKVSGNSKYCSFECKKILCKPRLGKKNSELQNLRNSLSQKGKIHSPKTLFQKGHIGFRERTGMIINCKYCGTSFYSKPKGIYSRSYCSNKCKSLSQIGRKTSEKTKEKLRIASIKAGCMPPRKFGADHYNWKGGITPAVMKIRNSIEYKLWRMSVLKRDRFTCVWCGQIGGKLCADHIQRFSEAPELRLAIDNGRTLCKKCHDKRHSK